MLSTSGVNKDNLLQNNLLGGQVELISINTIYFFLWIIDYRKNKRFRSNNNVAVAVGTDWMRLTY